MKPGDLKVFRCVAVRKPEYGEYIQHCGKVILSPPNMCAVVPVLVEVPVEVPEGATDASILFFTKRGMKAGEDVDIPLKAPVKKAKYRFMIGNNEFETSLLSEADSMSLYHHVQSIDSPLLVWLGKVKESEEVSE